MFHIANNKESTKILVRCENFRYYLRLFKFYILHGHSYLLADLWFNVTFKSCDCFRPFQEYFTQRTSAGIRVGETGTEPGLNR